MTERQEVRGNNSTLIELTSVEEAEFLARQPTTASTLIYHQSIAWENIKSERDKRTYNGGYYVTSIDKWFNSDLISRTQQLGLKILGDDIPSGIMWKTMDGSKIEITATIANDIFNSAVSSDQVIFNVAETHRDAMLLLDDPAQYDCSTGWPLAYGD